VGEGWEVSQVIQRRPPRRDKQLPLVAGEQIGRLVLVEPVTVYRKKKAHAHWTCRCSCGVQRAIPVTRLSIGQARSCGCTTAIDEAGKVYGKLTIIGLAPRDPDHTDARWEFLCECGVRGTTRGTQLRNGQKSCGCTKTHGLGGKKTRTREYTIWMGMRARCNSPRHKSYPEYGARGIRVCDRWSSYPNFIADMGPAPDGCSLDRRDPNGNYEPENCRWLDVVAQNNNRRLSRPRVEGILDAAIKDGHSVEWVREQLLGVSS